METQPQLLTSADARTALQNVTHIYTDLDGTMLAPGGRALVDHAGNPSTALTEALVGLTQARIEVIPVSGRNRIQLTELTRLLNLNGFLAEMGAVVVTGQGSQSMVTYEAGDWPQEIFENSTPYKVIEESGAVDILLAAFPGKIEYHTPWADNREISHLFRGNIDVAAAQETLSEIPLSLELLDNGIIDPPKHTLVDVDEIHSYHLSPTGIEKSFAIKRDMERRSLDPSNVAFIGDSHIDLVAAEHVGVAVLVQNALKDARVLEQLDRRTAAGKKTFVAEGHTIDGWVEFAHAVVVKQR